MEWLSILTWIAGIIYGQNIASRLSFKSYIIHIIIQAIAVFIIATAKTLPPDQIFIATLFFFAFAGGTELGRSVEKDYEHGAMSL